MHIPLALILAILGGGASVATIFGSGSQAVVNIEKIEQNRADHGMPKLLHMTPLGELNPSFGGK